MRQPGSPDRIALVSTTPMFHIPTCAGLRGTGSTTDVLEAALGALVAYFRVAPLEVSLAAEELEAEEWLVARIPSWTRMQCPTRRHSMSRSVCDALLLLATERRPELERAAIPSVLLGALPYRETTRYRGGVTISRGLRAIS